MIKTGWGIALILSLAGCSRFSSWLATPPAQAPPSPNSPNPYNIKLGWMNGSNQVQQQGVYGNQGLPDPANTPGGRSWMAYATDPRTGNLWLFGGEGLDSGAPHSGGDLNDLWMFNSTSKEWTWESGSDTANQASSANDPGAQHGGVAWFDHNGNFWLYGGWSGSYLATFWKYNTASGVWIPMASGAGGRIWAVAWRDSSDNLWIFGGQGMGGLLNDLWEYNIAQNRWTRPTGSTSGTAIPPGVYGTRGVASAANTPGGRRMAMGWTDTNGNLWLFGGNGIDAQGKIGLLNDLWKFDPKTGMWTWMGGSNLANAPAFYGAAGVASAFNIPGGRMSGFTWCDQQGNFWLFGGQGSDVTKNQEINGLNDLWKYSPATGLWTWMSGANVGDVGGSYGTLGAASVSNVIGARKSGASWVDAQGHLWLFGGMGFDGHKYFQVLNDVWEIQL